MSEVRTQNGKLVGTVDAHTNTQHIRDGKKTTMIEIPENGLNVSFYSGIGTTENVFVPPLKDTPVCLTTKDIPERILKKVCTEVLGLEEFDENIFPEKVERITVPQKEIMVFHFMDGSLLTKPWVNTAKKDSWTPERRAQHSEQLKRRVYTEEQRKARSERAKARWASDPDAFGRRREE